MNYTPIVAEIGVYSLTVCVNDTSLSSPHTNISLCLPAGGNHFQVCDDFTLTVTSANRAPEIINYFPLSTSLIASGTQQINFNATVKDPDGTIPDIDWYVDGTLVEHNENILEDSFSYTFGCGVEGSHSVSIVTSDGLLSDSQGWLLEVSLVECSSDGGSGGGGGGGNYGGFCLENWACDDWEVCQNIEKAFNSKEISFENYVDRKEKCSQNQVKSYRTWQ